MKHRFSTTSALFLLLALLTSLTGCINESLDECPPSTRYALRLKVVNANGDDITPLGEVRHSTLFVFEDSKKLLEKRRVDEAFIVNREEIELNAYPVGTKIHIVGWGNLSETNQILNEVNSLEDLQVYLKKKTEDLAQEPDSLFFGLDNVVTAEVGIADHNQELTLAPKTGTLKIETKGLANAASGANLRADAPAFDFYMTNTKSGFDNEGNQIGDDVRYNPEGELLQSEWVTKHDYSVLAGKNVRVSIDQQGKELGGITEALNIDTGEQGPINTYEGKRTYVIIYFGEDGSLSAKMKITDWGVVDDNIEF